MDNALFRENAQRGGQDDAADLRPVFVLQIQQIEDIQASRVQRTGGRLVVFQDVFARFIRLVMKEAASQHGHALPHGEGVSLQRKQRNLLGAVLRRNEPENGFSFRLRVDEIPAGAFLRKDDRADHFQLLPGGDGAQAPRFPPWVVGEEGFFPGRNQGGRSADLFDLLCQRRPFDVLRRPDPSHTVFFFGGCVFDHQPAAVTGDRQQPEGFLQGDRSLPLGSPVSVLIRSGIDGQSALLLKAQVSRADRLRRTEERFALLPADLCPGEGARQQHYA